MCHRIFFSLTISLLLFATTAPARAQWAPTTGPNGGKIWALAAYGNDVFAGTTFGFFHSSDNGISWKQTTTGLANLNVRSIAEFDTVLFAGTDGSGVFRSMDTGRTWVSASKGFPLITGVSCFAAIGSGPSAPMIFVGTDSGVFRSPNNGSLWSFAGLYGYNVVSIAVIGSDLLAGTVGDKGGGAFLSTDMGTTWSEAGLDTLGVMAVTLVNSIIGGGPQQILAGTYHGGAYLASITDTHWVQMNNGLLDAKSRPNITSFAVSGTNIYAASSAGGVVLSKNNGASWDPVIADLGLPLGMVSCFALNNAFLFAAMDSTVYRKPLP